MKIIIPFVFVLLFLFSLSAVSQITFQKSFGSGDGAFNTKTDYGTAVQQTSDGGYIVAGYSENIHRKLKCRRFRGLCGQALNR